MPRYFHEVTRSELPPAAAVIVWAIPGDWLVLADIGPAGPSLLSLHIRAEIEQTA
jgi:hypothetical protein